MSIIPYVHSQIHTEEVAKQIKAQMDRYAEMEIAFATSQIMHNLASSEDKVDSLLFDLSEGKQYARGEINMLADSWGVQFETKGSE